MICFLQTETKIKLYAHCTVKLSEIKYEEILRLICREGGKLTIESFKSVNSMKGVDCNQFHF